MLGILFKLSNKNDAGPIAGGWRALLAVSFVMAAPLAVQAQESPQAAVPSASSPEGAPAAAEAAPGDIVVRGQAEAPTRSDISRQARSIAPAQNMYRLPLARFEDRLCPGVAGLAPEYAGLMVGRIRAKAEELKMWMGEEEKCSPNFIVAFVDDGQKFLNTIAETQVTAFKSMRLADMRALLAETGPVRVWMQTATRTRDGMPIPEGEGLANPPVVQMAMAHSKIYLSTREDITSVMVLFDKAQMVGKSLDQLADYAIMRGIAQTRPPESDGTAMDTILTLFDPAGSPPLELTSFDNAYLASLYDSISNLPAAAKLLGVNRQLRLAAKREEEDR